MLHKTSGLVLHTLKYNDSSNIVQIYTEELGKLSFLVPASRSKKSALRPVLFQPLSLIELETDIRPNASLYRIKEAKAYHPYRSIPYNPVKSAIVLFLNEFLYRAIREESENRPLFAYLSHSLVWLDECEKDYANFHLVFLMRLSRFLGLYPNLEDYREGSYFDLLNACFTSLPPRNHSFYIQPSESKALYQLMRMNYDTMHLFGMSRSERIRCLTVINDYYRLHLPDFPELKSLEILQELFR